ncbi:2-hydroxychromene-2-carboxylate isomerase [Neorhizobium sp. Rsf11]|uniref:2-hydroxychromene-2-carboxylate isomerase n=1 Tax=Neorhizobium phenanthreniclasticum TaxID=3157917 RepID=A0ABV0M4V0_9HYPH
MSGNIEYYFSITSPWAYLGAERLVSICQKAGVGIRPFLIANISENGWITLREKPPVRQKYVFEDLSRWAKRLGVPLKLKDRAGLKDAAPAYRIVIAAELAGKPTLALAIALQKAFWGYGEDIGDPAVRAAVASKAGYDGAALVAAEEAPDVPAAFQKNIALATMRGVFGSPTYLYGKQTFWGQDRLDFLEEALARSPVEA